MAGVSRYPVLTAFSAFIDAPDSIYGTGADGAAVLSTTSGSGGTYSASLGLTYSSSVFTMTRDLFLNSLSIDTSIRLNPAGYRILVKGQLSLGEASVIGYTTGFSTAGSIGQGGAAATSVTHSLGGNALATYTATPPTAAMGGVEYYKQPIQAIRGYAITASGGPTFVRGGAGGTGQAGGGVVIVAARYIVSTAVSVNAKIAAPATSPGGGGVILVISSGSSLPSNVSTDVTGANAGTYNYMQLV